MRRVVLALVSAVFSVSLFAQTSPVAPGATRPPALDYGSDMSLEDYLYALQQISPAARDGAEAYLQAFTRRCGRPLKVVELRRRVADGDGDPILMQMMRAAHQRDQAAVQRLADSIACVRKG